MRWLFGKHERRVLQVAIQGSVELSEHVHSKEPTWRWIGVLPVAVSNGAQIEQVPRCRGQFQRTEKHAGDLNRFFSTGYGSPAPHDHQVGLIRKHVAALALRSLLF